MTAISACPILSTTADAVAAATDLAADFALGAAARDRERELPFGEIDRLSASGLPAITVPGAFGGAGRPASTVAEVIRILAAADPNIAQIPHSHFVYVNLPRLAGSDEQLRHHAELLLRGARIANAQSERSGTTVADFATTIRPVDGRFRIDGAKYYCTGSLFAHTLAVLGRLDDPDGESGLADDQYVAFLPADTPGVRIVDDWQALGQRTTGSGAVIFDGVLVEESALVSRAPAVARAPRSMTRASRRPRWGRQRGLERAVRGQWDPERGGGLESRPLLAQCPHAHPARPGSVEVPAHRAFAPARHTAAAASSDLNAALPGAQIELGVW